MVIYSYTQLIMCSLLHIINNYFLSMHNNVYTLDLKTVVVHSILNWKCFKTLRMSNVASFVIKTSIILTTLRLEMPWMKFRHTIAPSGLPMTPLEVWISKPWWYQMLPWRGRKVEDQCAIQSLSKAHVLTKCTQQIHMAIHALLSNDSSFRHVS